ncbi:hypothetical protein AMTRI_Chr01g110420 [Amborella trichopoda]
MDAHHCHMNPFTCPFVPLSTFTPLSVTVSPISQNGCSSWTKKSLQMSFPSVVHLLSMNTRFCISSRCNWQNNYFSQPRYIVNRDSRERNTTFEFSNLLTNLTPPII